MRRWALTVGVIGASVTGCGGNERGDPFVDLGSNPGSIVTVGPTETAEPEAPTPSLPLASPSEEALASPDPIPASVGSATAPEPAPTPAAPRPESLEAGFQATVDASVACLAAPAACAPDSVVAAGGPEHDRYGRLVSHYAVAGYVVRRATGVSSTTVEESELGADGLSGFVVVCDVDGDIVVEPGSTNGYGLDLVINDQVVARRVRVELRVIDGQWRRWAIEPIGEWPMEATCLAA